MLNTLEIYSVFISNTVNNIIQRYEGVWTTDICQVSETIAWSFFSTRLIDGAS